MLPKHHIILGFIFAFILYFYIGLIPSLIILLASVLIDVDHYLAYIVVKKDFNLKKAFTYFYEMGKKTRSKRLKHPLCILHTIEVLLVLGFISAYSNIVLFILSGFLFHSALDLWYMAKTNMLYTREFLLINYFKGRWKLNRGAPLRDSKR